MGNAAIRPSEKQAQIMAFGYTKRYTALVCNGAVRSGKTSIMTVSFVDWAMRNFKNRNFAFCSKTVMACYRNVIKPYVALRWARDRYIINIRRSDNYMVISNGEWENTFYIFGGRDESSYTLIQGITLAGVMLDEAPLMPESFVNQALARCSVEGARFWFSCNPAGSTNHWFYRSWIEENEARKKKALVLHFSMEDNPSLSAETLTRYKAMWTGVFYQRYILGMWVQAEGLIYPMYLDALIRPFEPARGVWDAYALSIDYGTQNAFAALLWGRQGQIWYAFKEYRYSGRDENKQKTDDDYVRDMLAFVSGIPETARADLPTFIDPSAASFIAAILRTHAGFRVRKADNDVLDGIRDTAVCLQRGTVKIFDTCKETIKEIEGYVWDDKKEDNPVKINDHMMDAMRYFVRTMRLVKPVENYVSPFTRRV